ncbi:unnamed protein product, partial [Allacma fusca]
VTFSTTNPHPCEYPQRNYTLNFSHRTRDDSRSLSYSLSFGVEFSASSGIFMRGTTERKDAGGESGSESSAESFATVHCVCSE